MNMIVKTILIVGAVLIWIGVSYGFLRTVVGIYRMKIDTPFTLIAIKQLWTKPSALFDLLQERANVSITLAALPATVNIYEDKQVKIEDSKVKGIDQYSLTIRNLGKATLRELSFRCQFPQIVLGQRIILQPSTGKVTFTPAGGGEWRVAGDGEVRMKGKISSPYYQLYIEEIQPSDSVELRVDLRSKVDSHPESFESFPDFPKDKAYFIAGTYKQKVGNEMVQMQIYYPVIINEGSSLSLGSQQRELPNDLLYGIGFD